MNKHNNDSAYKRDNQQSVSVMSKQTNLHNPYWPLAMVTETMLHGHRIQTSKLRQCDATTKSKKVISRKIANTYKIKAWQRLKAFTSILCYVKRAK